ncbi:hypothetical protein HPP92_024316 [Vanilla planifolia]|uniref:Uncharacterized protein n=1 Tax=Vanilla planifolia TaxID=51239 RepID=A0A835PSK4_VANPL|nr:hypothetical protein HPP92_024316 [Vanilla planifolia]
MKKATTAAAYKVCSGGNDRVACNGYVVMEANGTDVAMRLRELRSAHAKSIPDEDQTPYEPRRPEIGF